MNIQQIEPINMGLDKIYRSLYEDHDEVAGPLIAGCVLATFAFVAFAVVSFYKDWKTLPVLLTLAVIDLICFLLLRRKRQTPEYAWCMAYESLSSRVCMFNKWLYDAQRNRTIDADIGRQLEQIRAQLEAEYHRMMRQYVTSMAGDTVKNDELETAFAELERSMAAKKP